MTLVVCNKTGIAFQCSQCYHGREHLPSEDCEEDCPRNKDATCIEKNKCPLCEEGIPSKQITIEAKGNNITIRKKEDK